MLWITAAFSSLVPNSNQKDDLNCILLLLFILWKFCNIPVLSPLDPHLSSESQVWFWSILRAWKIWKRELKHIQSLSLFYFQKIKIRSRYARQYKQGLKGRRHPFELLANLRSFLYVSCISWTFTFTDTGKYLISIFSVLAGSNELILCTVQYLTSSDIRKMNPQVFFKLQSKTV